MCQGYLPPVMNPKRPHLLVYNWPGEAAVRVDLKRLWRLRRGRRYRLVNAGNVFGRPDAEGTFTGRPISLRLSGSYAPTFACYVVTCPTAPRGRDSSPAPR